MISITAYTNRELTIASQNFFSTNSNLYLDGNILCSLKAMDFWGKRYEINCAEKIWQISKPSWWKSILELKEKNTQTIIATYEGDGALFKLTRTIQLPKGERLLVVFNIWHTYFELQNELGTCLIRFRYKKWYSDKVTVTIEQKSETLDKYPFLPLFIFMIEKLRRQRSSSVH